MSSTETVDAVFVSASAAEPARFALKLIPVVAATLPFPKVLPTLIVLAVFTVVVPVSVT